MTSTRYDWTKCICARSFKKERREHPTMSVKAVRPIVRDHLIRKR